MKILNKLIILFLLNINTYLSIRSNDSGLTSEDSDDKGVNSDDINDVRKEKVKEAFLHAWGGYKKYAWGRDELLPLNKTYINNFQGWGATLVDSLTTLWLMGLTDEFNEAVDQVEKIDFSISDGKVNFFETTIRFLGGLIGAYDLSGKKVLLNQAIKLADLLMVAFESPSGLPYSIVNFEGSDKENYKGSSLAMIGSCQLEFTRLTQLTKDKKYEEKAMAVINHLHGLKKNKKGLYYNGIDPITGEFISSDVSYGAEGDSFYEYLIKVFMLTGKTNKRLKKMYLETISGFKTLLRTRNHDGLIYFIRYDRDGREEEIMDHLCLFMGGLLQYGDFVLNKSENSELGLKLVDTGYQFINISNTKLAPEIVKFSSSGPITIVNPNNYLRPELLESLFYSWRYTKDPKYRDRAWEIFEAFNKYSRTSSGFSSYLDVQSKKSKHQHANRMESFFLAETLKYLYLIFSEDSVLDLNEFVLNTEAHPFKLNSAKNK
jgi:mannosyl-oligosaccharide alpha-1,2-mannosidase